MIFHAFSGSFQGIQMSSIWVCHSFRIFLRSSNFSVGEFVQPFTRELQPQEERYWRMGGGFGSNTLHCCGFRETTRFVNLHQHFQTELCGCRDSYKDLWVFLKWCPWITKNTEEEGEEERGKKRSDWPCFEAVTRSCFLTFSLACSCLFAVLFPCLERAFLILSMEETTNPQVAPSTVCSKEPSLGVKPGRGEGSRAGLWSQGEMNATRDNVLQRTSEHLPLTNKYDY